MKKILITGGSGFIGTNLIDKFTEDGHDILNIDIKEPRKKQHNKYWKDIDITHFISFKESVEKYMPDYIVHLAARTDLDGVSLKEYSANIEGVKNLMSIVKSQKDLTKILITSSMLVCETNYEPLNDFDHCPTTIYGESKVQTERNVWANSPYCDWAILRPTSIWGPWFDVPYKNFFNMIKNRRYFHIGNRSCTKTYGFIGNAVYQINEILFADTINSKEKVFYLGDYEPTNIEIWADEISHELGFKVKKIPFGLIKFLSLIGDGMKFFNINFPLNSFRLKNMTTNNIVNLDLTKKIAPKLPFKRDLAIRETLLWLNKSDNLANRLRV